MPEKKYKTKEDAILYLSERYDEQVERFPTMRVGITKEQYIMVNLPATMKITTWEGKE